MQLYIRLPTLGTLTADNFRVHFVLQQMLNPVNVQISSLHELIELQILVSNKPLHITYVYMQWSKKIHFQIVISC